MRAAVADTAAWWRDWSSRCESGGPWLEQVRRSLITLKALTYQKTGGIVAAPTTSLPEQLGGVRNWDYRYCWLRDATLTLLALLEVGYVDEAREWRDWLLRSVAGWPSDMQIMYGPAGERRLTEIELDWLPGYEGAAPVRIGNAASEQFQLDVYGELMDALLQAREAGLEPDPYAWRLQRALLGFVEEAWTRAVFTSGARPGRTAWRRIARAARSARSGESSSASAVAESDRRGPGRRVLSAGSGRRSPPGTRVAASVRVARRRGCRACR